MVSFGMVKKSLWLGLLILVNAVHFGTGLAADRIHRWTVDEPAATDAGSANKEDHKAARLEYAGHSQDSIAAINASTSHSRAVELDREANDKLSEFTVANRSVPKTHGYESTNASLSKSSPNKTASASLNGSAVEHALDDSTGYSASDATGALNYSQAENIVRTTLCANGSHERETMRIEVEFASTLLENGLYFLTLSNTYE